MGVAKSVEEPAASPVEEPPAPSQAPPSAPCLSIEFVTNGETRTVEVSEKPLGLGFGGKMPIRILKVTPNMAGARCGTEADWVFKSINGKLLDGMEYNDAMLILRDA